MAIVVWLEPINEFLINEWVINKNFEIMKEFDFLSVKEWDSYEAKMLSSIWEWCKVDVHFLNNRFVKCKWSNCELCKEKWNPATKYFWCFSIEEWNRNVIYWFNKWTYWILKNLLKNNENHVSNHLTIEKKVGWKFVDILPKRWVNEHFKLSDSIVKNYDDKIRKFIDSTNISYSEIESILDDKNEDFKISFDDNSQEKRQLKTIEKSEKTKEIELYWSWFETLEIDKETNIEKDIRIWLKIPPIDYVKQYERCFNLWILC